MTPAALPPTSMDALREELARVRAKLAEYIPYEPTVREEMAHLREENDRLGAIVGHLLSNALGTTTHSVMTDDLDALADGVLFVEDVDGVWTTLRYIAPLRGGDQ